MTTSEVRRSSRGLGRGLGALIPVMTGEQQRDVPISEIRRNPMQPRGRFEASDLATLAASIADHGVLQPVLVTPVPGGYQLVAGERRVRAAGMAGLERIPVVIRTVSQQEQLGLALIENLQRADLNAMEEARAFQRLADEFGLTQDEIAARVGRSRPAIANTLRLLGASGAVQDAIEEGTISEGHGRAIAGITDHQSQGSLLRLVVERALSVRQTEEMARERGQKPRRSQTAPSTQRSEEFDRIERGLSTALGTKVMLAPGRRGGRIVIEYYDTDDLTRLYERLGGAER